ncbi:MAG TPA: hypothetical protein VNH11_36165 [Pirellulales bacterium]|nr:hypothetical protein [Pirellulales bacterium]
MTEPSASDDKGGHQSDPGPWEMLGIPEPPFLDDRMAPQVDRQFLQKFVRGELPKPSAEIAARLVLLFASWHGAHQELLASERKGRKG